MKKTLSLNTHSINFTGVDLALATEAINTQPTAPRWLLAQDHPQKVTGLPTLELVDKPIYRVTEKYCDIDQAEQNARRLPRQSMEELNQTISTLKTTLEDLRLLLKRAMQAEL